MCRYTSEVPLSEFQTTPPTEDMGVDPISLDTTTMGNADTLPEYHAGDNGLLERNLYSGDTNNKRISISPSTFLSQDSVSNSHFAGTKSMYSTSQLLRTLLKYSIDPQFTESELQAFIQMDPPIFITRLPAGSAKTRPTGLRRGRPPRTDCELSGKKFCCPFMMDVAVAVHHAQFVYHHGSTDQRETGVAVLRTIIPVLRQIQSPQFSLSNFRMIHTCYMSCCYRIITSTHISNHTTSFQGGRRCRQRSIYHYATFVLGIHFVHSSLSSCERGCQTIRARGVD